LSTLLLLLFVCFFVCCFDSSSNSSSNTSCCLHTTVLLFYGRATAAGNEALLCSFPHEETLLRCSESFLAALPSAEANCADRPRRLRELICHRNRLPSAASAPPRRAARAWSRQWHAATAAATASSTCCGDGRLASGSVDPPPFPSAWRNAIRHPYIRVPLPRNFSVDGDGTEALKQGRRLPSTCRGCDVNTTGRAVGCRPTDATQSYGAAHHECAINQLLATVASRRRPSYRRAICAATIYRSPVCACPSTRRAI